MPVAHKIRMASVPISLGEIPTVSQLYAQHKLSPPGSDPALHTPSATLNRTISLIRADITTLGVGAIVNAANTRLLGGGGVDGAIHRAAGPGLLRECRALDGCPTGSAKITAGHDLPCAHVIHAVGPVYSTAKAAGTHAQLLRGCYRRSLELAAAAAGVRSLAFSALSTGVYGYPSGEAAAEAVAEVRAWLDEQQSLSEGGQLPLDRIVFCSFLEKDEAAYEAVVP